MVYKDVKISTIVDTGAGASLAKVYKDVKISTIVDMILLNSPL